jgi:hypothetical protein
MCDHTYSVVLLQLIPGFSAAGVMGLPAVAVVALVIAALQGQLMEPGTAAGDTIQLLCKKQPKINVTCFNPHFSQPICENLVPTLGKLPGHVT